MFFDTVSDEPEWNPRYNIAPTQPVPVIRQNRKEPRRELSLMRWGLIPSWAKDMSSAAMMINARSETAATKPAFRDPLANRRCLVPADGFYEWSRHEAACVLVRRAPFIQNKNAGTQVTMKGWERIQYIQKSGRDSKRVFVAMWFDGSMDEVYDKAIAPAISRAGYLPLRIDRHPHVNRIDDEIIGQIKRCRFMVADFTGQRHSVYFEAGMMHGLARNVIWMCKNDDLKDVRFDVRQFAFIAYSSVAEAEKLLYDKILAIEGEGTLAITLT